jgi:hypothetical protein
MPGSAERHDAAITSAEGLAHGSELGGGQIRWGTGSMLARSIANQSRTASLFAIRYPSALSPSSY